MKNKTVSIITNNPGCEQLTGYYAKLEKYFCLNGWIITEDLNADIIIVAGCGSTDIMFKPVKTLLEDIYKEKGSFKNVIIAGCIAATYLEQLKEIYDGTFVHFKNEHIIDQIIQAKVTFLEVQEVNVFTYKDQKVAHDKENLYVIVVAEGCLKKCTYCIINRAYGMIRSKSLNEIIKEYKFAVKNGYRKIEIAATDTSLYGYDCKTNIADLLHTLLKIDNEVQFYLSNYNARGLEYYYKDLLELVEQRKIVYMHIPLQHVNDTILNYMGRDIVFDFTYGIIKKMKELNENMYLSTDLICGFPEETEEYFKELYDFVSEDNCFNSFIINMFWELPGTLASKMDNKVPAEVKKHRLFKLLNKTKDRKPIINDNTGAGKRFSFASSFDTDKYYFCKESYEKFD